VNQLLDPNSHLKKAINISLKSFKLISIQHSILREPSTKINITIPSNEAFYGNDYMEVFGIKKNAFDKFFILKEYLGRENEMKFISFLESQEEVVWWHKQDNHGKDVFGVEYLDFDSRFKVFYPDFIIKTVENFYIVDTKAGITAQSNQTAEKNKSLQKWIENNPYVSDKLVKGGIVIERYPYWMINEEFEYKYENTSDWKMINFDN
jgi:type III restriction enzyme